MASSPKINQTTIPMANGPPLVQNKSSPTSDFVIDDQLFEELSTSETENIWDLTIYEHRLRTFNVGWKLDFVTPEQMAKAGLYFLGKQDYVRCIFCSKEFDFWERGDDPIIVHKRVSPECPFFKQNQGYDVCGPHELTNPTCDVNTQQLLDLLGVVKKIKTTDDKDFATLEARLKTFKRCENKLNPDIDTLCKAGFYYIGDGNSDLVICFYCDKALKDWQENEEPWREHALWKSDCSYILLSKGKNVIDELRGLKNDTPNIDSVELSKLIAVHKHNSILKSMNINTHKIQSIANQMSLLSINNDTQEYGSSKMLDSMLCKICYKEVMNVVFIPCGHLIACIQCALSIDNCAVCRNPFSDVMKVYICMDPEQEHDDPLPCSSSSQNSDEESSNPILCKDCRREEIEAVFLPCRHIYACVRCASQMHECPVCKTAICATMQVYLQ